MVFIVFKLNFYFNPCTLVYLKKKQLLFSMQQIKYSTCSLVIKSLNVINWFSNVFYVFALFIYCLLQLLDCSLML